MQILATMPGRFGDQLWALPTVRALHEAGHQVSLVLSQKYGSLAPLIRQQEYVQYVLVHDQWQVREDAPISPRVPRGPFYPADAEGHITGTYDAIVHLGYDGWPQAPLPYHVYNTLKREHPELAVAPLDLERPWIRVPYAATPCEIAIGFTDEWFELKVGLICLEVYGGRAALVLGPQDSRWHLERAAGSYPIWVGGWIAAAGIIRNSDLFLGCCSALHVLACALGKPCLIVEPSEARWNEIFYPFGKIGPRVRLILGGDGKPTFDSRHIRDTIDHLFHTGVL